MKYAVIDLQTGAIVGTFAKVQHARRMRDKLNDGYNTGRYHVREVSL